MEKNSINKHILDNMNERYGRNSQNYERERIEQLLNEENHGMKQNDYCNDCQSRSTNEHGPKVYVNNIGKIARRNNNFRESVWTGNYLQLTVMSIGAGDEIGAEIHEDADQYITIISGNAVALCGDSPKCICDKRRLYEGDSIFIPAGTWHNILNAGRRPLKLSSVYAPPHHPRCTVQRDKNQ